MSAPGRVQGSGSTTAPLFQQDALPPTVPPGGGQRDEVKSDQTVVALAKQLSASHIAAPAAQQKLPGSATKIASTGKSKLETLFKVLLCEVCSYLPARDLMELRFVSKYFSNEMPDLRKGRGDILVHMVKSVLKCKGTFAERNALLGKCLEVFKNEGEHITSLVYGWGKTDDSVRHLETPFFEKALVFCPNLRVLHLEGLPRAPLFQNLSLPHLRELVLPSLNDENAKRLKCTSLSKLRIDHCNHLDDSSLAHFATIGSALVEVRLHTACSVRDNGLKQLLGATRSLRYLDLRSFMSISDDTLLFMADNPLPLDEFRLSECGVLSKRISADGLSRCLATMQPRVLDLKQTKLNDSGLQVLATTNKRLEVLLVSGCDQVSDAGLREVMNARPLRYLDCTSTPVTDKLFSEKTTSSQTLEVLDISFCEGVTSAALHALAAYGAPLKVIRMGVKGCFDSITTGREWCSALLKFPELKFIITDYPLWHMHSKLIEFAYPKVFAKMFNAYDQENQPDEVTSLLRFGLGSGGVTFSSLESLGIFRPQAKTKDS